MGMAMAILKKVGYRLEKLQGVHPSGKESVPLSNSIHALRKEGRFLQDCVIDVVCPGTEIVPKGNCCAAVNQHSQRKTAPFVIGCCNLGKKG